MAEEAVVVIVAEIEVVAGAIEAAVEEVVCSLENFFSHCFC